MALLRASLPADISMNSNTRVGAGNSLRKKLTPSAAFINELKSKVISLSRVNVVEPLIWITGNKIVLSYTHNPARLVYLLTFVY